MRCYHGNGLNPKIDNHNSTHTGKSLRGKLQEKLTTFPFLTSALQGGCFVITLGSHLNLFETSLLIKRCFPSAREIVFSCFALFLLKFLFPIFIVVEMKPNQPAIPARGAPTITPIPLRETARPLDDKAAAITPVREDDV